MWPFAKSVILGTAVAAALPLLLTVVLAVSSVPDNISGGGSIIEAILFAALFAAYPILIALPIVLTASLVFGLPIVVVLRRAGRESLNAYVLCALVVGALIPVAFLVSVQAAESLYFWLPLLGALSGTVTAHTWWRATCDREVS